MYYNNDISGLFAGGCHVVHGDNLSSYSTAASYE